MAARTTRGWATCIFYSTARLESCPCWHTWIWFVPLVCSTPPSNVPCLRDPVDSPGLLPHFPLLLRAVGSVGQVLSRFEEASWAHRLPRPGEARITGSSLWKWGHLQTLTVWVQDQGLPPGHLLQEQEGPAEPQELPAALSSSLLGQFSSPLLTVNSER